MWEGTSGSLPWSTCYVPMGHEDFPHLQKYKYQNVINIHERDLTSTSALEIEKWCSEHFGKLDEYDGKCSWQVAYANKPTASSVDEFLVFLFKKKDHAAFFKLTWC